MDHAATAAGPVKSFWVPFPNARTYSYSVPLRGRTSIFHKSKKRSEAPLHWRQHKTHNRNKYRESATMRTEISGRRTIQYAFAILPIRPRAQRRRTVCLYKYGCRWFAAPAVCCVWRGRVRCATRRSAPIRDADLEFDRHPDLIRDHGSRPILPSQFSHSDTLDASLDVL